MRDRPASTPREQIQVTAEGVRDVSSGNPDPALLPSLGGALAAAAERAERRPVLYGEPVADTELERMARAAFRADGVPEGPVAVTSGALDAIERVLVAHLRPGDAVAVEDPGWGSVLDLIPALGLRPVPVAVDDDGPLPGETERALRQGARALIVTDQAQNPTGAAVGKARAEELRAVLAAHPHVLLVEDDNGHGIVDQPLRPLGGVTTHWALVRSVAKTYGPDLRLGLLTGDSVTLDRVLGRQRLGGRVGQPCPAGRGAASVAHGRGGRGRGRRVLRQAPGRAGGGAPGAGDRGARAQRDECVGARAGRDGSGGAHAAVGMGRGAGGALPPRVPAGRAADRLHPRHGRDRAGRGRAGGRDPPGGGRALRLTGLGARLGLGERGTGQHDDRADRQVPGERLAEQGDARAGGHHGGVK
ncbi:hypothetical protein GCM10020000_69080 [Streptomyces olivoverticillatus]